MGTHHVMKTGTHRKTAQVCMLLVENYLFWPISRKRDQQTSNATNDNLCIIFVRVRLFCFHVSTFYYSYHNRRIFCCIGRSNWLATFSQASKKLQSISELRGWGCPSTAIVDVMENHRHQRIMPHIYIYIHMSANSEQRKDKHVWFCTVALELRSLSAKAPHRQTQQGPSVGEPSGTALVAVFRGFSSDHIVFSSC